MAKKVASFRLDTDLVDWLGAYAKERDSSQAVIVEEALRGFKFDAEGGVPDLPAEAKVQAVTPQGPVAGLTSARTLLERGMSPDVIARQRKLNEAKARAEAKS